MSKDGTKRREWIKNAAIIFLSVLLVLTFFSQTIMNYSLPEVATQYIYSGNITDKIRGTGMIESGDPYNIELKESRKVESVLVKSGDEVQKGDILFVLADKESKELEEAEAALAAAILEFETAILSGTISNTVINNVQTGNISDISTYQNRIISKEAEIEKQQKLVDEAQLSSDQLTTQIKLLGHGDPDTSKEQVAVFNAQNAYDLKNTELSSAKSELATTQGELANVESIIYDYNLGLDVSGNEAAVAEAYEKKPKLQQKINDQNAKVTNLTNEIYNLKVNLEKAQGELANKEGHKGSINALSIQLEKWGLELTARTKKLDVLKKDKEQLINDIAKELSLDTQSDIIQKARENVAELMANATAANVEAPISGTITSVSIIAGQETTPSTAIATMQPEGKGFTMGFSVTNEQATKLTVGAIADLVNSWRYDDVEVILASIKPDPVEPGQKKLLSFDVTGSVLSGQSLSVSIGDKSANYDYIVPNSALHEDSNGSFILVMEPKSSPIGNRYTAVRYDVNVLAKDDIQAAISGGLQGYESVITTSTAPLNAGQLVRPANN